MVVNYNYIDDPKLFSSSSSGSDYSSCRLTASASAFSTLMSAFIGSVIKGLTSGWLVAFATGWIAWMAVFRILLSGLYMLYRSVTNSWRLGRTKGTTDAAADQGDEAATQLMVYDYQVGVVHVNGEPAFHSNEQRVVNATPRPNQLKEMWPPALATRAHMRSAEPTLPLVQLVMNYLTLPNITLNTFSLPDNSCV
jgi:hypothetical protein